MTLPEDPATLLFWPAATIAFYIGARALNRIRPRWWSSPLLVTPALLILLATIMQAGYGDYNRGSHWLTIMVGPATVAFALPIWERRAVIRRYWPILTLGVVIGSGIAMASAWGMAHLLGLSDQLARSLMPRSVTMPFAMAVSDDIGGLPDLTAVFVILTGVCGAAIGEIMLTWLPLRSSLARGALFGMGAHGAGVAKAHQIGTEEGSIAGLVMVLAGLFNVLMAPVLAAMLAA
ncbi:MAG: LrgB family protein [Tistrella sp.]|jgi:predicted murein hydrolase (TIGR00659 family)|uniref:Murein hydrolase effector protein LrgB n=1 Tax=Tistrella mobilis TaxID=171437 RepID=A0A162K3T9_9PROT|nr:MULTISPECIES: LrgB family protein [Tistrella]KYO50429.1 murein hydrolase effector protein LrgB [Tistrella mobilis]MAD39426.1 LrgB family protein [Tistrella sp.]MBA76442.1 LrgB family protein [Tistrella sp.]